MFEVRGIMTKNVSMHVKFQIHGISRLHYDVTSVAEGMGRYVQCLIPVLSNLGSIPVGDNVYFNSGVCRCLADRRRFVPSTFREFLSHVPTGFT